MAIHILDSHLTNEEALMIECCLGKNKGHIHTEESKKMSDAQKGKYSYV